MNVIYEERLWSAQLGFRDNLFVDIKRLNPDYEVKISRGQEKKIVPIKHLQDYSFWRNGVRS